MIFGLVLVYFYCGEVCAHKDSVLLKPGDRWNW